jgi:hypothetical protein
MPVKRAQSDGTPPDLSPQRAFSLISQQIEKLQAFKGQRLRDVKAAEKEWYHFTERIVSRAFGVPHSNLSNFQWCWEAVGETPQLPYPLEYGQPFGFGRVVDEDERQQRNFEARLAAFESSLKNCLQELGLDMPDSGVKGVYEPGEEYEFYRDVSACLKLANKEIFVIDPYLSTEIFDVYAAAIPRTVLFRLLSANIPGTVKVVAQKYATGGNFSFRDSNAIHDRVLFADNRVWLIGQSLKDAAKKKPTYIVEHDEPLMRSVYEMIWNTATIVTPTI